MKDDKKKLSAVNSSISKRMSAVDPNILVTSDYLANKYHSGVLSLDDIADFLKVKPQSVLQSISNHTMPFPVSKIGNQWFCTAYDVAAVVVKSRQDRSEFSKAG